VEVSEEDYIYLSFYTWMLMKANGYVKCNSRQLNKEPLHKIIARRIGLFGEYIDHKDRNKLNCRRDNLRSASRSESNANRVLSTPSGYRGVSWHEPTQKWQASIWKNRKIQYLGWFEDIEDAAKAYDQAAIIVHGNFAVLNFERSERA